MHTAYVWLELVC